MKITVKRSNAESGATYTHGRLFTDECGFMCWTLEDTDRGLTQSMTAEQIRKIKKYGETAIPTGTYRIKLRVSPKLKGRKYAQPYGGMFPYIEDVPGFSNVMIHPGNSPAETLGCILPGDLQGSVRGRVFNSQLAWSDLMQFYIWPAYKRGEEITITIE